MVVELSMKGSGDIGYRVHFGQDPDYMPIQITAFSEKGKSIVKIDEYYSIEVNEKRTYWPKSVKHESSKAKNGKVVKMYMDTTIRTLELGKELPPGIFELDFTRADLVWDDDLEMAVKHPKGYVRTPDLDILDSTTDAGVVLDTNAELQTDALINRDTDKAGPVSNDKDISTNPILPIASQQHKSSYIWAVAILLVSGITMLCLWGRSFAAKRGLKNRASSDDPYSDNLATRK